MVDDKEEKMDEIVSFFFSFVSEHFCQHFTGLQHEHTTHLPTHIKVKVLEHDDNLKKVSFSELGSFSIGANSFEAAFET